MKLAIEVLMEELWETSEQTEPQVTIAYCKKIFWDLFGILHILYGRKEIRKRKKKK